MRKGDLARVVGGEYTFPVFGYYKLTPEEVEAWQQRRWDEIDAAKARGEDTFHLTHDSAGESILPPRTDSIRLRDGDVVMVLHGRRRWAHGYGNPRSGYALVRHSASGRDLFVHRMYLEVIPRS